MALILSIETSATRCSVALHGNGKLIRSREILEGQSHASKLAVLISELFVGDEIRQLNAVAISAGPGSYTGLRIGTSTAKGICYALGIPLISVPTLDLLGFQFTAERADKNGLLCPMIDAKRMEVYCQVMNTALEVVSPVEPLVVDAHSFNELLSGHVVFFFGDGAEKCRQVIAHKNAVFIDGIIPSAAAMGEPAFSKFGRNEFEDLVNFTPFYLKDFIARKAQSVF